jgi:hypothetical protein
LASEFDSQLKSALEREGVAEFGTVLADNSGEKAETLTRIVLGHKGLPDGSGGFIVFQNVIHGQYNDKGNGIDLIGITNDGTPIITEIKKRRDPSRDSLGQDSAGFENLEPETLALRDDILREREVNPALRERAKQHSERLMDGEPDSELSTEQMSGLWVRDRWFKLIKNDDLRAELEKAGVRREFLDVDSLKQAAYSPQWRTLLDGRTTVVVSSNKDNVTNRLLREALFKRGFNTAIIDLTS